MHAKSATALKPKGTVIVTSDLRTVEMDTLQCVHCGCHWTVVKGSGKDRGFCAGCMGPTCGKKGCDPCVPYEKRLDILEHMRE